MNNKKLNMIKNIFAYIFIVVLFIQLIILGLNCGKQNELEARLNFLEQDKTNIMTTFVKDIVRQQERQSLNAIRESWIQYINLNNIDVLQKDDNNFYLFSNDKKTISFNPSSMKKESKLDGTYIIKDIQTNEILLDNCRPKWNKEEVKKILSIIASPAKVFNESAILVFDTYNGEILLNTSKDSPLCSGILNKQGNASFYFLYRHPRNKNKAYTKTLINEIKNKSDSKRITELTSLFNEEKEMDENKINDFSVYPLGEYNRDFIEKLVLPYESVGVEGLDMQLTVLIKVNEKDIFSIIEKDLNNYGNNYKDIVNIIKLKNVLPNISIILNLLIIMSTLFFINLMIYYCKRNDKK